MLILGFLHWSFVLSVRPGLRGGENLGRLWGLGR